MGNESSSKAESEPTDEAATDEQSTDADTSTPSEPTAPPAMPDAGGVEFERRFNELRKELLDDRAKLINWWLTLIAILLTSFGVIGAIIGYIGFSNLKEIEVRAMRHEKATKGYEEAAKGYKEAAKSYLEQIKQYRDEAAINAKIVANDPAKAQQFIEDVSENPKASSTDKAIAEAILLQEQEKIEEALKIWRGIANAFEEVDRDISVRSWLSVGYLFFLQGKDEDAIAAYDEAIDLKPDYVEAYNNRGNAKSRIDDRLEDAIADYDEAISRKPDYAEAYFNRGNTKRKLDRIDEARQDFEKARDLARKVGDASLVDLANQQLRKLDSQGGK